MFLFFRIFLRPTRPQKPLPTSMMKNKNIKEKKLDGVIRAWVIFFLIKNKW